MGLLRFFFLPLFCLAASAPAQTIIMDNFNNPGATGAVLAVTSWVGNVTRNPDTITVAGTAKDDNGWGAFGQSLNATGKNYVTITAQRDAGNIAPSLVLQFEDSSLRTHTISVNTSQFAVGTVTTVQVPIGTWPTNFNFANITGWNIGGGTSGIVAFGMTIDQVALSATASVAAPVISEQPFFGKTGSTETVDHLIGVGTSTTLSVTATGTPPLRYQWKRNGADIVGATTASLPFANVQSAAADVYQVAVSNDGGITLSRIATLTVVDVRPSHALATANATGYVPGDTITLSNTITYTGSPTTLGWRILLPAGWKFVSDGGSAPQTKPAVGAADLLEWSWTAVPGSSVFTVTLSSPSTATGAQAFTSQATVTQGGVTGAIFALPDPLIVPAATLPHSADIDRNFKINLNELTRIIELYNTRKATTRTGAYAVATITSEDGFSPDPNRAVTDLTPLTRYHSADANHDARFSLVELTRVIELYNTYAGTVRTGAYHVQAGTEDGFAPGP